MSSTGTPARRAVGIRRAMASLLAAASPPDFAGLGKYLTDPVLVFINGNIHIAVGRRDPQCPSGGDLGSRPYHSPGNTLLSAFLTPLLSS